MGGPVTSLSTSEQQALDSIKDDLASCDPALAARLTIFTRLASGEEMPARENVQAGSRRAGRGSRPPRRHPGHLHGILGNDLHRRDIRTPCGPGHSLTIARVRATPDSTEGITAM